MQKYQANITKFSSFSDFEGIIYILIGHTDDVFYSPVAENCNQGYGLWALHSLAQTTTN